MPKLTWTRVDADIRSVDGLPVRLRKWRATYGDYWAVQVPSDPDTSYRDGWEWADAWTNDKPGDGYPQRMEAGTRLPDAMRYVAEHLEQILAYAAKQRSGWPHTEGVPSWLGEYVSHYAADGSRTYTGSEPPAPVPPRQVTIDHVTDDDVQRRLAGVQPRSLDPYEQIGVRRPNAHGWPVLLELSSVQFEALLQISGAVAEGDVSEHAQPLREIHRALTNIDPRNH